MKKSLIYILIAGFIGLLTACEKEVTNIKLPQATSKLVVTSFISPQDTALRVSVVESVPAIGKNRLSSDNIRNVTVSISNGENSVELVYDEKEKTYIADAQALPVVPGKTYFLTVSEAEGRKVEASCTVPVNQKIAMEVTLDSAKSQYSDYMEHFMILKWQDTPGEINYYRVFAEILTNQGISGSTYYQPVYFEDYSFHINLYTDARLDGAKLSSSKGSIWKNPGSPQNSVTNQLYVYLLNTDEPYYRYHQSLNNNFNTDGNPFAEPVLLYSNVTGGLGVFASYNRNTITMDLE